MMYFWSMVIGSNGNDFLYGANSKYFYGLNGNDTYYITSTSQIVIEFYGQGIDTVYSFVDFRLGSNVEILVFDAFAGSVSGWGNGLDNSIYASLGNSYLYGLDGNDSLYGWSGNDYLDGGNGNDRLYGGQGDDRLIGDEGQDLLYGGDGKDNLYGGHENDRIYGGRGNDTIFGDHGIDLLFGDEGNDHIYGGIGNDYLWGGDGNDYLSGKEGLDYLNGGDGDDILLGGAGADELDGGSGVNVLQGGDSNDAFTFNKTDTFWTTIIDFEIGIDILKLIGFRSYDLAFSFTGSDQSTLLIDVTGGSDIIINNITESQLDTLQDSFLFLS